MMLFFEKILDNLSRPKYYLILGNILLVFFLILLFNLGVLPFENSGDFIFFVILTFAFALYRPGWVFLFFIGTIALENISLISRDVGLTLRPYQLLGILSVSAVAVRFFLKRLNFLFPKFKWCDAAIILIGLSGFFSTLVASNKLISLKLSVIVFSFIVLYFLTRIFIQDRGDIARIIPFFLGSSFVVVMYGIWQNNSFIKNQQSFEIMPGRPNATFSEADWLGMFLVLIACAVYVVIYKRFNESELKNKQTEKIFSALHFWFLVAVFILLIITVSRSAWLGTGVATLIFLIASLFFGWKSFLRQLIFIISAGIISIAFVYFFNLTNFQLFNRIESTGTGLQKITIACEKEISLPEKINNAEDLAVYNCRHINLEEIEAEKAQGNYVSEIYRNDPNVSIRSEIYKKSWEQIKQHCVMGIGWGNLSSILGKDERGTGLNSSNIFLETWLGAGIVGLIALLSIWSYIFLKSIYMFFRVKSISQKSFALFLIISWIGLTTANLFNAGIMLGFLWVYIAVAISTLENNFE